MRRKIPITREEAEKSALLDKISAEIKRPKYDATDKLKRTLSALRVARVASAIAEYSFGINTDLLKPTRGSPVEASARQVAIYLMHTIARFSLQHTAEAFDRDRSSVAHACHLIEDRRDIEKFDFALEEAGEALKRIIEAGQKFQEVSNGN